MSSGAKPPKKLKALRTVSLIIALLILYVTYSTIITAPSRLYERAKQSCQTELWMIERDAVFYDIRRIQQPYPEKVNDLSGETVVDFACSQQEAEQKRKTAETTGAVSYFLGLSIVWWGPLILTIIIWWVVEETRYWQSKK